MGEKPLVIRTVFAIALMFMIFAAVPVMVLSAAAIGGDEGEAGAIALLLLCVYLLVPSFLSFITFALLLRRHLAEMVWSKLMPMFEAIAEATERRFQVAPAAAAAVADVKGLYARWQSATIARRLAAGESLAEALRGVVVRRADVDFLETADQAGRADDALRFLVTSSYRKKSGLMMLLLSGIQFLVFVMLVVWLFVFIIPIFKDQYNMLGAELPFMTQSLMAMSDIFVNQFWILFLILLFLVLIITLWATTTGLRVTLKAIPFLRTAYWEEPLSRFAFVMAICADRGRSAADVVEDAARCAGTRLLNSARARLRARLEGGASVADALSEATSVPNAFVGGVRAVEKRREGERGWLLLSELLSSSYTNTLSYRLGMLLPPVMLGLIGFTGIALIALYLPLFHIPRMFGW